VKSGFPVVLNQGVGGTIVLEWIFVLSLKFRHDACSQRLSQFDPPLVKGVDIPKDTLSKDAVLVEGNELSQGCRSQPFQKDGAGRTVALKGLMRH